MLLAAIAVLAAAALFVVMFQHGYVRLQYPSANEYPVRGIDVSRHPI